MSAVPRAIARLVDARDDYRCVRCGISLRLAAGSRHHRQRRAVGGHTCSNLVLLCGSGTTACHGWVHQHPDDARKLGLIVRANGYLEPHQVPVKMGKRWFLLNDVGDAREVSQAKALLVIEQVA